MAKKKITYNNGEPDVFDRCPICYCTANTTLGEIKEFLWTQGGQGYKFGMVFDLSHDEYELIDDIGGMPVYYLDEILEEVAGWAGKKVVK